ncbi:MAG TPA: hypothetical protein VEA99_13780, partial [Gemmatimonadaceae bacterium]|nr:hypothetical protein [Gemmatimonadaceae bacterium]
SGVTYDVPFVLHGVEALEEAMRSPTGGLVVGTHARLSLTVPRAMEELGYRFHIVAVDARLPIAGAGHPARTIPVAGPMLLRVRTVLRRGEVVCAMLDRVRRLERRTTTTVTAFGPVQVVDPLLHVGAACRARVVFVMSAADARGRVHAWFTAAPAHARPDALARQFAEVMMGHAERCVRPLDPGDAP